EIEDPNHDLQQGDRLRWSFGESVPLTTTSRQASHQFDEADTYLVKVEVLRASGAIEREISTYLVILPGKVRRKLLSMIFEIQLIDFMLSLVALVVACLTALTQLYVSKPYFGSLTDYLMAILWGFGLDVGLRGFTAVYRKVSVPAA